MIAFSVQLFFAWRGELPPGLRGSELILALVKLLVSNTYVTTAIMLCSLVQMRAYLIFADLFSCNADLLSVAGIATAVACGIIPHFIEFYKFKAVVIIWLAFAAIADVLIAVSLVLHLVSFAIL